MKKRVFFVAVTTATLIVVLLNGCVTKKKKIKRLDKFNSKLWISDKDGCRGDRLELKDQLLSVKHLMRGFKDNEIESILGKPDAQELYKRGQQYYIYFIEAGSKCTTPAEKPLALFVKFSAVGLAVEFTIRPFNEKQG